MLRTIIVIHTSGALDIASPWEPGSAAPLPAPTKTAVDGERDTTSIRPAAIARITLTFGERADFEPDKCGTLPMASRARARLDSRDQVAGDK